MPHADRTASEIVRIGRSGRTRDGMLDGVACSSAPRMEPLLSLRARSSALLLSAVVVLGASGLAGCAADWSTPHAAPTPVGTLGAGFLPASAPAPEATLHPAAGSWDDIAPSSGFRVVLLVGDDAPETRTLAAAVHAWSDAHSVDLREIVASTYPIDEIVHAMDMNPDLIISVGNGLIDPLTTVSASHLERQFLVLGAELPEPTHNVTAVDWSGASFRGTGNGTASPYDATTFTPERSAAAVRAGVAAVLHDLTGVVLWID